jgi:hypothetical protein
VRICYFAGLVSLILAGLSPAAEPPKACAGPEFRQFDFWIGSWLVRNESGKEIGRNDITHSAGSCALLESWKGGTGIAGTSVSYYDPFDSKWHQDWVGSDGSILHLVGGLSGQTMVLTQRQGNALDRVTWTPLPDGKVKQQWEQSTDAGKTWKTSFAGIYERS